MYRGTYSYRQGKALLCGFLHTWILKPKEVSLDPSLKVETPIVELPSNENKLFDEEDDVRTSTIPDLSLPSEHEEEEIKSNHVWEYAIDVLFKLSPLHPE